MKQLVIFIALAATFTSAAFAASDVPADIQAVFDKPLYKNASWGLRVVDLHTGKVVIDLKPQTQFYIGSVRKTFTVGELLNEIGPHHTYNTPVFRQGRVDDDGVLHGNLILLASGDLTMDGRTNRDGTIAITDFDHNEADSLGNAGLTKPDPLRGYRALAQRTAASGIKEVKGNVVIDDRLFQPFNFRKQFDVTPAFVNDDVVDLTIHPTTQGNPASVVWRPVSPALGVNNSLITSGPGSKSTLKLDPEYPQCIGQPHCTAAIRGELPIDFLPPLTNKFPLIQTFRITKPSNYARTVFIQELEAAGVKVDAPDVAENPVQLLSPRNMAPHWTKVAQLIGRPYSDDAKFILKVSYNIGADTSLVLYGLTQGVNNEKDALRVEEKNLSSHYGITPDEYHFLDGSGGGETTAVTPAVTKMLSVMSTKSDFPVYLHSLPILGVDGSLGFVTDFQSNPKLKGATGHIFAKPGSYLVGTEAGLLVKGQAFGGYIDTKSGQHLVYMLVVNNVKVNDINDLLQAFQDQGTISAILWRDY